MDSKPTIVVGLVLAASLVLSSCEKKKPPVPPPQAQAPTITDTTSVPAAIPEVSVPEPTVAPEPTKPVPAATKPKKKPKVSKTEAKKTPATTSQPAASAPGPEVAADKPSKVIVESGGKSDPNPPPLIADTANEQAARQRLSTAQLINAAEANVRNLTRQLSSDETEKVQHIRGYIEQSKEAAKAGDTTMAYNLAVKAKLMSDTLVKP